MKWSILHIWFFPLAELTFFLLALYFVNEHFWLSVLFLFTAASFMAFTLHISAHYQVHHPSKRKGINTIRELFYTLILSMPFHFYRFQHIYHHIYDNEYGDMTSTWNFHDGNRTPASFFVYCFLWPVTKKRQKEFTSQWEKDGKVIPFPKPLIKREAILILSLLVVLGLLNIWYGLFYLALFYLGWTFIAIVNYGQHLPLEGEKNAIGFSYIKLWYNKLLINNGLHFEHHKDPRIPYWELSASKKSPKNIWPQLIDGFRMLVKK